MPVCKLAISNIAWHKSDDEAVYTAMQQAGFTGLEIAPTRIFPAEPYENLTAAALFGGYLKNRWGFAVPACKASGTASRAAFSTLPRARNCWTTRRGRSALPTA